MPINEFGMNSDYVSYFPLEEYIGRIKLLPEVLIHLEETSRDFEKYMHDLIHNYDEEYIINFWLYSQYEEFNSTNWIENKSFNQRVLENKNLFFDTLNISHKRIHSLHNFITDGDMEPVKDYRHHEVNVSRFKMDGTEEIFWRGANACDVNRFMNDFIKVYKHHGTSLLYTSPFLVSSLMHLLFVRIHPYMDGNGRTARLIHNLKFTEAMNDVYGTKLKLSPLNLSQSILINKVTYAKRLDNIYFDTYNDTNLAINMWFDFILNMVDEQIYYSTNQLQKIDNRYHIDAKKVRTMGINKIGK